MRARFGQNREPREPRLGSNTVNLEVRARGYARGSLAKTEQSVFDVADRDEEGQTAQTRPDQCGAQERPWLHRLLVGSLRWPTRGVVWAGSSPVATRLGDTGQASPLADDQV